MRPTTENLEAFLDHISGEETSRELPDRASWRPFYRVALGRVSGNLASALGPQRVLGSDSEPESDREEGFSRAIKARFGGKTFYAGICFIDMVGFSALTCGKAPAEVEATVKPFISSVIEACTRHQFFVEKTIGDEVMVVAPLFPEVSDPLRDVAWFMADLVQELNDSAPRIRFTAGVAFGEVALGQIRAESYEEWTVYGNCVSGAKRLQALPAQGSDGTCSRTVWGAIDAEQPGFGGKLERWLEHDVHDLPVSFSETRVESRELKGVGMMSFVDTYLLPRVASSTRQPQP